MGKEDPEGITCFNALFKYPIILPFVVYLEYLILGGEVGGLI